MRRTTYASVTDPGGRPVNEDFAAAQGTYGHFAVVVADGLGSCGGGSIASKAAVVEILKSFQRGDCLTRQGILDAVGGADAAVKGCQSEGCAMKTTLAALFLEGDWAIWVHVGDTRLYHFKDEMLLNRTMDHSVPQLAVQLGMITEDQIRFHEDRSRILRALGSDSAEADLAEPVSIAEGFHAFLLCTDGFWEYVLEQEMEETLRVSPDPEQWLAQMTELLRQRAPQDQDNYTAAVVFTLRDDR